MVGAVLARRPTALSTVVAASSAAAALPSRHTSIAAARSSIAVPTDLNSVISSSRCGGPCALPRQRSNRSPWMSFAVNDLLLERNRRCRRPPWARRARCRRRRARAAIASSSASRMFGVKAPTRSTWAPFLSQAPRISGSVDSVAQDTMSAVAHRGFEVVGDHRPRCPPHRERERGRDRAAARAVPQRHPRDRPHRAMRAHEMRRERAGADHDQMRGVLAREIARRERRRRSRAPGGQRACRRSPPAARRSRPTSAGSCRRPTACRALALSGNTLTILQPSRRSPPVPARFVQAGISSSVASLPTAAGSCG